MTALIHALFPSDSTPAKIKGEVRFVSSEERSQPHGTLGLLLTVCVPSFRSDAAPGGPAVRGRLRDAIESAIENALDMNDAPAAGVGDLTDLDQCLSDQLYRARSVGAGGLVIYLPDLGPACSLAGVLDAEDSAVLRWWIAATNERPVMLLLEKKNRRLGAYGPPMPLEQWAEPRRSSDSKQSAESRNIGDARLSSESRLGTESKHVAESRNIGDARPNAEPKYSDESRDARLVAGQAEARSPRHRVDADITLASMVAGESAVPASPAVAVASPAVELPPVERAAVERPAVERVARPVERTIERTVERTIERSSSVSHIDLIALPSANGSDQQGLTSLSAPVDNVRATEAKRESREVAQFITKPILSDEASLSAEEPVADRVVPLFPRRESPFRKPVTTFGPGYPGNAPIDWRAFANDLAVARGPKPLTFVERLFMTRYIPLLEAVARGETDDSARRTAEQWSEDFARSYTEGFNALRVTGKRPRMVLDAPQLASQVARLHGAKSTHLVLVDGMRFDLGLKVHDRMCEALTSQATCTERLLLWSALPTTTPVQLDLLAHGPEGLASRPPPSEQEEPGVRGRQNPTLRRIRLGARELLKLDTVQARLAEAGPALGERLDTMADDVAAILSAHARNLPPRSLMFVFGDHGFRMDATETGTSAGSFGGASPEEVLVPGFAWLVGDVH